MPTSSSTSRAINPSAAAQRLIQNAHLRDGLPEIAAGLLFLLSGVSVAPGMLPRGLGELIDKTPSLAVFSFALFIIAAFASGGARAMKWVRRRYLIARVGYIEFKPLSRKQICITAGIMFGPLMALALLALLFGGVRVSRPEIWVPGATGVFWGALWAWLGRRPRFVISGALIAASGLILAFSGVPLSVGVSILLGLPGLVILTSGTLALLRLLRLPVETNN